MAGERRRNRTRMNIKRRGRKDERAPESKEADGGDGEGRLGEQAQAWSFMDPSIAASPPAPPAEGKGGDLNGGGHIDGRHTRYRTDMAASTFDTTMVENGAVNTDRQRQRQTENAVQDQRERIIIIEGPPNVVIVNKKKKKKNMYM